MCVYIYIYIHTHKYDPCLIVRIDIEIVMQVYWVFYNRLFGTSFGNSVFVFRTCMSRDKIWDAQPVSDVNVL
ncbi:hypothetical protein MTR_0716s0040 [Medicago truncatula]|uniref:Uncharacterized protein n=1 Tax=Medicago truncatula TaxID=3880 RepID=G7ZUM5_MEDTR|nr:hypothetical protein MTR_0716s0040 [Medicago truncatula]